MHDMPIIRLELRQMKATVHSVLTQHTALVDEQIKAALDAALHPDAVQVVISAAVKTAVDEAISEEIRNAFRYGSHGRKAIREAVEQFMEEHYGETGA